MVAFEIGADIVGVIGLTIQIIQVIIKFGLDWKDAPKDIKMFITELQGPKTVLSEANSNITMNPDFREAFQGQPSAILSQLGSTAIAPGDLKATVEACSAELEKMLNRLKSSADKSRWTSFIGNARSLTV
ncbi:hypothetical protein GP486_003478 [Trichoglossum hirsutum]|uniref:Uncharacterized protein n=1 Tax=Trichoglossum hirsutum TaxID=265104 RepID=A0A9P8RQL8_9PEZI|nr:hypothetical protein GP486_003478 [Trichoglossum hirsutum]